MNSRNLLLVLMVGLALSGCKTLDVGSVPKPAWMGKSKPKYQTPVRVAAIWADAMLAHPTAPTRGFGGRFYFYNPKNEAIPVDGELTVYAYDDTLGAPNNRPPDRKFVFTGEQLTSYFDETQLGASYSVWLPWDRPGSGRRDISLVPIFTAADGTRVVGQHTKVILPGDENEPGMAQAVPIQRTTETLHRPVQPVGHVEQASSLSESAERTADGRPRSTTISLSPATTRRLQESAPIESSLQQARVAPQLGSPLAAGPAAASQPGMWLAPAGAAPALAAPPVAAAAGPQPAAWPTVQQPPAASGTRVERPSARSVPPRFPAPGLPIERLDPDRSPRQPYLATPRSDHP